MPKEPPPSPPKSDPKALAAYVFYAAAIWAMVAYSLWGPRPAPAGTELASAGRSCLH